jgi:hypothetical protein
MLELILVLPLYVMILFVVITLSEFGQASTQAYQAARILAWQRRGAHDEPGTTEAAARVRAESFAHFKRRVRVQTGGAPLLVPLQEDGTRGAGYGLANGAVVVPGAHAYEYGELADPLYVGNGTSLDAVYQDDAAGANLAGLARLALRGSDSTPARRTVPWLRRHYARVSVTYFPIDDLFGLRTRLRVRHTVLRGATWNTAAHAPYRLTGHPNRLRDAAGYPFSGVVNLESDNHQLELTGAETDFEPDMP